ncbi:MAG: DUF4935 domain-containing protein [Muribaculaceae bacterium]|nr:DUF4935 domain-containing protein [Muribaculaceae bacterium]
MKKLFAEYYELTEERINEIWDNSLIVFDTNVLLNLYRYNDDTREEFIKVIKFYKERLWIPYQVGLEFHRRREEILRKNAKAYSVLAEKLSKDLVGAISSLEGEYARHPYISIKDIKKKVKRCAESIAKSLEKQGREHPDYLSDDKILQSVTNLLDGRVGNDFDEKDLEALYKEGEKRYANKIPPGYCDEKNKKENGKRGLYGDLIVWKQTILHCKEQAKSVIFITDDHKLDWWDKKEGKHSPRKELIKEFSDNTGQSILIYDSGRFLDYAKRNKELKVSQKTLNEISKVKTSDSDWDEYNSIRTIFSEETIRNLYYPIDWDCIQDKLTETYSTFGNTRFPQLDEFRQSIDKLGGFSEVQRRMQEMSALASVAGRMNLSNKIKQNNPIKK